MPTKIPVQKYLKADLFEELELSRVTPEQRVAFLESFGNIIQQRIYMRVMTILDDNQKNQLEALLTEHADDADAVGAFLNAEIPEFQKIVEEEVASYKKSLIDRMKA